MDKITKSMFLANVFSLFFILSVSAQEIYLPMDRTANKNSLENKANSANGKVIGQITYVKDRFGNDCRAASFDGKSYVSIQNSASLDVKDDFTFTAWLVLPSDNFQWLTLICKGEYGDETNFSPAYRVQLTSRTVSFNSASTYDIGENNSYNYPINRWFHLAFVKDGSDINIYVDGQLLYTEYSTIQLYNNSETINIGRDIPGNTEFFKGKMDDVRFFTKALNKKQISKVFKDDSYKNLGSACPASTFQGTPNPTVTTNTNSTFSDLSQIDIPELTTSTTTNDSDLSQMDIPELTTSTTTNTGSFTDIDITTDQPINLKNIRFEQSKDVFLAIAYPELENLVSTMKANPTLIISLNGHTDNVGDFHKNNILSGQRIAAVKKYLTDKGINSKRILHLNAYGATKPITDNSSEELREKNRRVEVLIVSR